MHSVIGKADQVLQKQVLEKLILLEDLNRQYRQLVRTSGIDLHLRSVVQEVNQRWENLQRRIAAVYKRLKYFVNQWEEFESERETIQVRLMELDLRLTDVEHFSGGTLLEKMIRLQAFQQDVQRNAEHVDRLLVHGECLIQKSQPEDAEILEEELQDLSCFCQEVFRRVFRFQRQLVSMRLVFENEWLSDRESDLESNSLTEGSLDLKIGSLLPALGQIGHSTPKKCPLHNKGLAHNLGTTMDLEWDPSVDVGGSTSHDEEDSSYYSAITGVGQWEEPSRRCRNSRQMCHPLPVRCACREGSSVQNDFQEEWEPFGWSSVNQIHKEIQNGPSRKFPLWHLEKGLHQRPTHLLLGKGNSCQTEPVRFDPKRIESWLGQAHQDELEIHLETEQVAGSFGSLPLPAAVLRFPAQSRTNSQQMKQHKPQQRRKKRVGVTPVTWTGQTCKRKQMDPCSEAVADFTKKGYDLPQPSRISTQSQKSPRSPPLLSRLMLSTVGLLLLLLLASACVLSLLDPSCLRTNGYTRSFHLELKYIKGPPPT
ncbi:nesprin-4 isoform X2 [Sphaerodactylus townsendi]|uniref:nesprin-4 isoform X2 n=1 Tax=Sphaerodactylus townsendi TaxID=933632 RepID=UPI002025DD64|nr:nesprin-4 isoform X2 [Sphaerodactylus townsendi]